MENDRSSVITLCGKEYEAVLSIKATQEITKRYGGLEQMGNKLTNAENAAEQIDEALWLVTLLIDQGVQRHNLLHPDDKRTPLTEDEVAVLASPADFTEISKSITSVVVNGSKRSVESEDEPKNTVDG